MTAQSRPLPPDDRLLELLADRALEGLSAAQEVELQALLKKYGLTGEEERFELAAAAAGLAMSPAESAMPEALRQRLVAAADEFAAASQASRAIPPGERGPLKLTSGGLAPSIGAGARVPMIYKLGWLAAAACLVLAVVGWLSRSPAPLPPGPGPQPAATVAQQRDQFMKTAPDLVRLPWGDFASLDDKKEPPEMPGVRGEVVWSDQLQKGYITFQNLPANDPTTQQYQLWIVDAARGLGQRVDGGVFDSSKPGECVVAINSKLHVSQAAGFAVTIEKPGGVVISDMARRVVIALKG